MNVAFFSRNEAAVALSISVRLLDYLRSRGELAAVKIGRRVLIPRAEVERFVREKCIHRTAPTTAEAGAMS